MTAELLFLSILLLVLTFAVFGACYTEPANRKWLAFLTCYSVLATGAGLIRTGILLDDTSSLRKSLVKASAAYYDSKTGDFTIKPEFIPRSTSGK
jgi:hypothetical protein